MRVLVAWGSERGGTAGIAETIADQLSAGGFEVTAAPAAEIEEIEADAVILGGALYANRWHVDARRFVDRHLEALRRVPVWLFSSGPLDDSARFSDIAPTRQVAAVIDRVGALGHATFGGRLAPEARGFLASRMAKQHAGDWRDTEHIRGWARRVAAQLPDARPGVARDLPGRSIGRLLLHGAVGWAVAAAALLALPTVAHLIAVPAIFAVVAWHYFGARGARAPLPAALAIAATVAALDAGLIAGLQQRSAALLTSATGMWLPIALAFATTWLTGALISMSPTTGPPRSQERPAPRHA